MMKIRMSGHLGSKSMQRSEATKSLTSIQIIIMGNRIHVQIRREIEYGDYGFNWQIDELKRLLEDSGCDVFESLNEDAVGDWEIPEEQFKQAVDDIETKSAEEIGCYFNRDFIGSATYEEFKKEVVTTLRCFERTGDHRKGYYHFSWF